MNEEEEEEEECFLYVFNYTSLDSLQVTIDEG